MAKTTGALFSIEASGQFAETIVFDKRGFARVYKIPANPKTAGQGDQRQRMANIQRSIGQVGATDPGNATTFWLGAYKAKVPQSYRWQSYLLGAATKGVDYDASKAAWLALGAADVIAWNDDGTTAGIVTTSVPYATEVQPSNGEMLFHLARAIWFSGATNGGSPANTLPNGSNSMAWAANITG